MGTSLSAAGVEHEKWSAEPPSGLGQREMQEHSGVREGSVPQNSKTQLKSGAGC